MPSGAAFQAPVADPDRKEGLVHLEAGLADSYTMQTTAIVDGIEPFE